MKVTQIRVTDDGVSHFQDCEVDLHDGGPIGRLSAAEPAASIIFRETPPDYDYGWHHAPARQYILILDGTVEIEVSDGAVQVFRTGDVLLVDDTWGDGHRSRAIDGRPRRSVFVTLE